MNCAEAEVRGLQSRIQRAGRRVSTTRRCLRWVFWSLAAVDVLAFVVALAYDFLGWRFFPWWLLRPLAWIIYTGTPLLLLAMPFIFPAPGLYRWLLRRKIRRQVRAVPREQRAATLLPLREDPDAETRKIVGPLLQELGVAGELSPAPVPAGRGDEASPAE